MAVDWEKELKEACERQVQQPIVEDYEQCQETTQRGTRCTRLVRSGMVYCAQHEDARRNRQQTWPEQPDPFQFTRGCTYCEYHRFQKPPPFQKRLLLRWPEHAGKLQPKTLGAYLILGRAHEGNYSYVGKSFDVRTRLMAHCSCRTVRVPNFLALVYLGISPNHIDYAEQHLLSRTCLHSASTVTNLQRWLCQLCNIKALETIRRKISPPNPS